MYYGVAADMSTTDCRNENQKDRPNILWSLTFELDDTNDVMYNKLPAGVHVVPGPDARIDFEQSIAKVVFAHHLVRTYLVTGVSFTPRPGSSPL